jgi:hypothetical protein
LHVSVYLLSAETRSRYFTTEVIGEFHEQDAKNFHVEMLKADVSDEDWRAIYKVSKDVCVCMLHAE